MSHFYLIVTLIFGLGLLANQLVLPVSNTTYAGACSNGGDPYGDGCHAGCKTGATGRVTDRAGNGVSGTVVNFNSNSSCTDEDGTHTFNINSSPTSGSGGYLSAVDIYKNSTYSVRVTSITSGYSA